MTIRDRHILSDDSNENNDNNISSESLHVDNKSKPMNERTYGGGFPWLLNLQLII